MNGETALRFSRPRGIVALWVGWIIGPVAWLLDLVISYTLVPWVCRTENYVVLHLVTVAALLLVAGGAYLAWRGWQRAGWEQSSTAERTIPRSRFLAAGGIMLNVFFFLIILAQGIANFMLDACQ